jgi:hypothetical protein
MNVLDSMNFSKPSCSTCSIPSIDLTDISFKKEEKKEEEKHEKFEPIKKEEKPAYPNEKIFILVCSRDLSDEEMDLLTMYGKVLVYDDCHINLPLDQLVESIRPSYIVFDIRLKPHRMALSKEMSGNYHIIAIVNSWEKEDDFIDDAKCENCLSSLPLKQAFKKDFDKLLVEKKIRKPSCMKNILRMFFKIAGGWQKN